MNIKKQPSLFDDLPILKAAPESRLLGKIDQYQAGIPLMPDSKMIEFAYPHHASTKASASSGVAIKAPFALHNLQNEAPTAHKEVRIKPESPLSRKKRERHERIEQEKKEMAKLLLYNPYDDKNNRKRKAVQFYEEPHAASLPT